MDRRTRPDRIAAVLRDIDADVVALQEVVGAGPRGSGHIEEIGAALGMGWVMAPARQLRGHQFGNAVLSRFPIVHHAEHDLSWKTCEERCLQRADIDVERAHAARLQRPPRHRDPRAAPPGRSGSPTIVSDNHVGGAKLVLGDFNEWMRGADDRAAERAAEERRPDELPEAPRAPIPACSRSCTSITSTTPAGWRSSASSCRARASRSSPRIICRWWPTFVSDRHGQAGCRWGRTPGARGTL